MQPVDKKGRGLSGERAAPGEETSSSTSWRAWVEGLLAELTPVWMRKRRSRDSEAGAGTDSGREP